MKLAIVVFVGSGLGGVCRFLLSGIVGRMFANSLFPWGTFFVNILGCFLIGLIYGLIDKNIVMSQEAKLLLTTGFCGGLTTFSTFSHENLLLFHGSNHPTLLIYAMLSMILGFAFAWLGHLAVR